MATTKKIITEEEAVAFFQFSIIEAVEGRWSEIIQALQQLLRDETFSFDDDEDALFNLLIAVAASELGALKNVFPPDQADRIFELCVGSFSPECLEYARCEIEEYRSYYQKALDEGENPIYAIPVRLLHRWLGDTISKYLIKVEPKYADALDLTEGDYVDPLLVQAFTQDVFFGLCGFGRWKGIHDQYQVKPDTS